MPALGELIEANEKLEFISMSFNKITNKGIEELCPYLLGNITLKSIGVSSHNGITDAAAPSLLEVASKSYIKEIHVYDTGISKENQSRIESQLQVPVELREILIHSKTKSAAKIEKF